MWGYKIGAVTSGRSSIFPVHDLPVDLSRQIRAKIRTCGRLCSIMTYSSGCISNLVHMILARVEVQKVETRP